MLLLQTALMLTFLPLVLASKIFNILDSFTERFNVQTFILLHDNETQDNTGNEELIRVQKYLNNNLHIMSGISTVEYIYERLKLGEASYRQTFVLTLVTNKILDKLQKLTKTVNISIFGWILLSQSTLNPSVFNQFEIPFNCEFIVYNEVEVEAYKVYEVYHTTTQMITNRLGHWDATRGLQVSDDTLFSRRSNLHHSVLKFLVFSKDPCSDQSFAHGSHTIMNCVHQQIWMILANKMNFTTEFTYAEQATTRFRDITLDRKELLGSSEAYTVTSAEPHTFFWPTVKSSLEVYTKYLGQDVGWKTYLGPFTTTIWVLIVGWIVLATLLLKCVTRLINNQKINNRILDQDDYFFMPFSAFCNQGSAVLPTRPTQRLLTLLTLLVPAVLVPAYSASLTSFLAIQQHTMPFTDLEGLSRQHEYKLGARRTFDINSLVMRDSSPLSQQLLKNTLLPLKEQPETEHEGVQRMCRGKFSFLDIVFSMYALNPPCKYYHLNKPFLVFYTSMPMASNSPYNVLFNRYSRTLRFTGVLQILKNKAVLTDLNGAKQIGSDSVGSDTLAISIEHTVFVLVIMLAGFGMSLFLFILEITHKRFAPCAPKQI